MIVYLFSETSNNTPVKISTMGVYTSVLTVGKRIIEEWSKKQRQTLQNYIISRYAFKLYITNLDEKIRPKLVNRELFWEAMGKEDGLKKEITKAMLKE